jgi:predicted AlkP superfamily phosphohydrolase/phosphomutase
MAASIASLHARHDYELVFVKTHLLDHLQHAFWGGFDPLSPWYGSGDAPEYERLLRAGYVLADAFVRRVLEGLGPDWSVVIVSDHGQLPHLKAMSPNNVLRAARLLTATVDEDGPRVDWSKTKAYSATALGHVYVNLAGRDPHGIVRPEEYESAQAAIQDALLAVRDPESGERVVELAITKREAAALGQGGDRAGDVIYAMRPGYSGDTNWFPLTPDGLTVVRVGPHHKIDADFGDRKFIAGKFASVHGCSLPTVSLGRGTELATLILAGPGIRSGYERVHYPELVDVAPTIAELLDLPMPRTCEGRVLRDVFDSEG